MTKSLKIDEKLEKYISDNSYDLHPVQKKIIKHNNTKDKLKTWSNRFAKTQGRNKAKQTHPERDNTANANDIS